jgi:hypothetical protein
MSRPFLRKTFFRSHEKTSPFLALPTHASGLKKTHERILYMNFYSLFISRENAFSCLVENAVHENFFELSLLWHDHRLLPITI